MSARTIFLVAVVGLLGGGQRLSAQTPFNQAIGELLQTGWRGAGDSFSDAELLYRKALELAPEDIRSHYAMAVVAIKHRRLDRAREFFDALLDRRANFWLAERGRIWVMVIQGEHKDALAEMVRISERLGGDKPTPSELDQAALLGRICGYFEAPADDDIDDETLQRAIREMVARMGEPTAEAFREAQRTVIVKFADAQDTQQQIVAEETAAAEQRNEQTAQALADEKSISVQTIGELESRSAEIKQSTQERLSKLDQELVPINQQAEALARRAAPVISRIKVLSRQLAVANAQSQVSDKDRPGEAQRARMEAERIRRELEPANAEYRVMQNEGRALAAQAGQLLSQRQAAVAAYDAENKAIIRKRGALERRLKRIEKDEEKLAQGPTIRRGRLSSQRAVAEAFSSYEPFPLEIEKQRVLNSLK